MSNKRPLARQGLVIEAVDQETLVYDNTTHHAYVLNPMTSAVWNACNGQRTVREIAQHVSRELPASEAVVWYALRQLDDLLQETAALPHEYARMTRRQFLSRTGLVATALTIPVVAKIAAPSPAQATSTCLTCTCNDTTAQSPYYICADCVAACAGNGGLQSCDVGCGA